MSAIWEFLENHWSDMLVPLGFLAGTMAAGGMVCWVLEKSLARWKNSQGHQAGSVFFQGLRRPILFWSFLLGLSLGINASPLSTAAAETAYKGLQIIWVLSLTFTAARLAGTVVFYYGSKLPRALAVTSLAQNLARGAVITIGFLILLNLFGVSIC